MANIIELIAKLRDEASGGLEKLGTNLRRVADSRPRAHRAH